MAKVVCPFRYGKYMVGVVVCKGQKQKYLGKLRVKPTRYDVSREARNSNVEVRNKYQPARLA